MWHFNFLGGSRLLANNVPLRPCIKHAIERARTCVEIQFREHDMLRSGTMHTRMRCLFQSARLLAAFALHACRRHHRAKCTRGFTNPSLACIRNDTLTPAPVSTRPVCPASSTSPPRSDCPARLHFPTSRSLKFSDLNKHAGLAKRGTATARGVQQAWRRPLGRRNSR